MFKFHELTPRFICEIKFTLFKSAVGHAISDYIYSLILSLNFIIKLPHYHFRAGSHKLDDKDLNEPYLSLINYHKGK